MKKNFLFATLLLSGFVVSSCSKDEVSRDFLVTRSYDFDSQILAKFIDINKAEGIYYINESKKSTALSYVTDWDWRELQKVSPANRAKVENELKALNLQLITMAERVDVSQIVYTTYSETWIRNIENEAPFRIERSLSGETKASRTEYGRWRLDPSGYPIHMNFSGNCQIKSDVGFSMSGMKSYFFEIVCQIEASKTGSYPEESGNNPKSIVFSGTWAGAEQHSFTWTIKDRNITWVDWNFKGAQYAPDNSEEGTISVHFAS